MQYKGYQAHIEYDEIDNLFFGQVINIDDVIIFDGLSVEELEQAFRTVVDQYLEDCHNCHKIPNLTELKPVAI